MASPEHFDLVVVGAGPGGSAAALAALRERPGARVLILDRSPLGRDKVCGDGVGPDAATELARLGVADVLRPEEIVSRFELVAGPSAWRGAAEPPGYVVPRVEFDRRLVTKALSAGAELRQHTVREIRQGIDGVSIDGRFVGTVVIGADGANSAVRRSIGEAPNRGRHLAVAVRGYAPRPPGFDQLRIHWDPVPGDRLGYAWAFPTTQGTVNLGYGSAAPARSRASLVRRAAELLPDFSVESVQLAGHLLPLATQRPRPAAGRVLLVGDAASLVNPLTGEGIYYALASGALAGAAALRPDAARHYSQALGRRVARHHRHTAFLSHFIDNPKMMAAAVDACSSDERMFAKLLSVGLGDGSFTGTEMLRLARAALRPAPR